MEPNKFYLVVIPTYVVIILVVPFLVIGHSLGMDHEYRMAKLCAESQGDCNFSLGTK